MDAEEADLGLDSRAAPVPADQTIPVAHAAWHGGMTELKQGLGGLAGRVAETAHGWKPGTPKFQTIPQANAIDPKNVERLSQKAGLGVGLGAKLGSEAGAPKAQTDPKAIAIGLNAVENQSQKAGLALRQTQLASRTGEAEPEARWVRSWERRELQQLWKAKR